MSKKYIGVLFTILLILFSFYYTSKIIKIFREKDPIMIEIKKYNELYSDTKVESTIFDNEIIPGIKGIKIDIDKSYSNMKKTGKFEKNLLVFEESLPKYDISNTYDKYIISLNKQDDAICIIFVLNDFENLDKILSILNTKKVNITFFINKTLFDNNYEKIKKIISSGNEVELLSDNYSIYEVNKYNSMIKLISNDGLNFCLNNDKKSTLLKSCESSKLYSVVPNINISKKLYNYVKNNLKNGLIISLSNNKNIVNELASSINYIMQKGKKIVMLKNILN